MLFELSNLNSNLALTLGYLNPAGNNSAQKYFGTIVSILLNNTSKVENCVFFSATSHCRFHLLPRQRMKKTVKKIRKK